MLLDSGWGTPPFRKEKFQHSSDRTNAEWFSDEKLMLLFLTKILVMPQTPLFKEPRIFNAFLITSHSFLISLMVSLCGQERGWYSTRRKQGEAWQLRSWAVDTAYQPPSRHLASVPQGRECLSGCNWYESKKRARVREDKGRQPY